MEIIDVRDTMPVNPDPRRRYKRRKRNKISKLVLHCTDMDADLEFIALYDVTPNKNHHISPKACPGFTYHYFIESDGTIKYTMDIEQVTWHVGNHNGSSVGVCINYVATNNPNPPPAIQLEAARNILTRLCLDLGIDPDNIKGHRELSGTGYIIKNGIKKLRKTCPGMLLNMDETRYIVACAMQKVLANLGFYRGKIDGAFGPKSETALRKYKKREVRSAQ